MSRTPKDTHPDEHIITADQAPLTAQADAVNTLAVLHAEQETRVRTVASALGYQLPADCADPDLIQRDIAANMRRSVEACLEVGRGLRVLKEACEHGNFIARLDVLGLDRHVAARFAQAATKFSNVPTSAHLVKAIGTQSKLLEMLILDDEQIEELELTGQTGELKLDDIATMSVKELRAALRQTRSTADSYERLLGEKDAKINKLAASARPAQKVALTDWPAAFEGYRQQAAAAKRAIEKALSDLEVIRATAMDEEIPPPEQASFDAALESLALEIDVAIARAEQRVGDVRRTFDQTLGAWLTGAGAQD